MRIRFVALASPDNRNWEYEMTPCSAVPRIGERIVLPNSPGEKPAEAAYRVSDVIWRPADGVVVVHL